jgi:hypothetical protein
MDTETPATEGSTSEDTAAGKPGRPPPIILTTPTNLIQLQKQLKDVVAETFEFSNTRNGTRVLTKSLADFQSVKSYFDQHRLFYSSFIPKSEKPFKAVIRHLPINIPAEDISDGLVNLGFDVISVKQMTTTRRSSPDDPKSIYLPLFLTTLPRSEKSQEIFRLPSLCHIVIKVEAGIASPSAITASSSAMSGLTASSLHAVYGARAVTCTRSAPRRRMQLQPQRAVTAGWRKVKTPIPPTIEAAGTPRSSCRERSLKRRPSPPLGGSSRQLLPLQACPSRRHSMAPVTNTRGLRHPKLQLQPRSRVPPLLCHSRKQVNQSRLLM